ncbi:MAG TPA: hypothetical protein VIY48_08160, partial [Candidatus Paceibacterota bacterium]
AITDLDYLTGLDVFNDPEYLLECKLIMVWVLDVRDDYGGLGLCHTYRIQGEIVNDKQFNNAMNLVVISMFGLLVAGVIGGIGAAVIEELNKPTAPTYHCDGPGYPAPGTAEARACWIEGAK